MSNPTSAGDALRDLLPAHVKQHVCPCSAIAQPKWDLYVSHIVGSPCSAGGGARNTASAGRECFIQLFNSSGSTRQCIHQHRRS
jgi:hypothetical protein